jgi:dipeptidyl aminopeptidase/acylaminoacyl peptidase
MSGPLTAEVSGSWSPSPAPDGLRVAMVSDRDGTPRAWIHDVAGAATALDTGPHPVVQVSWSTDGAWIACALAPYGAPRTELWLIRPDGTGLRQVAGFGGETALLGGWVPGGRYAGRLMVTETDTGGRALLIDPASGDRMLLAKGDLLALLDVWAGPGVDGGRALLRRGPRGARHLELLDLVTGEALPVMVNATGAGEGSTDRGCLRAGGDRVLARTDVGTDLAMLVEVPVRGPAGTGSVLAARTDAELEAFAVDAGRTTAALLWNVHGGRGELELLDLATGARRTVPVDGGEVLGGCAFSADGRVLALTAEGPGRPRGVWLVDVAEAAARPTPLPGAALAEPAGSVVMPVLRRLRCADGTPITGWLYQPAHGATGAAVISLHAGPEAQERPGYNPLFQALVAHGVAVFAPNVRGSSGFGRAFVNADNGAGRFGAIGDVAACVAHLVETGVARPGRIGCMGRSYGGYLTLAALVNYPELFTVGVDVCGMADFATFFQRTEAWIAAAAVSKYGHPEHDRGLLRELSPLHRIDRLAAPLLVVHGDNDTNVPTYESEQVAAALARRGFPHRFLRFADEGHEFLSRANREVCARATLAWLLRHLCPARSGTSYPTLCSRSGVGSGSGA